MTDTSKIFVPAMPQIFPKKQRSFPITERENLMRMLNHEKPLWMPHIFESSQEAPNIGPGEVMNPGEDFTDAFGVKFKFSEQQGSATPVNRVLSSVTAWKDEVKWPDLSTVDFEGAKEGFVRDESLALTTRLFSACFEHLHFLEGFEQALVDLVEEPEVCEEFFDASVDYFIELFDRRHALFPYDWVFYNDDWGTAHGPFFSTDTLRGSILRPTKRFVNHIQSKGVKVIFHNCGKIESFLPILIDEIGADGLDIQPINDLSMILREYGDRITPTLQGPDPYFFYDPETTLDEIRAKARHYVDLYGAQANPGAGVILMPSGLTEEKYNAFMDEIIAYSMEQYGGLQIA
jgi:hypothetical protein